jgi:hypothetical protein
VRRRPIAKIRFSKAVLLVLLALQLVIGLQLQVARAASVHTTLPPAAGAVSQPASDRAQADCPTHSAHGTDKHAPMGTHDCCHASACQCHCVYTPAALALPALANIVTSDSIPSLASAQFVAPRIDEFLRPPIA